MERAKGTFALQRSPFETYPILYGRTKLFGRAPSAAWLGLMVING
jgi:hypothetical protein